MADEKQVEIQEEQKKTDDSQTTKAAKPKVKESKSSRSSEPQSLPRQEESCQNQQLPPPPHQGGQQQYQQYSPQSGYCQQPLPPQWGYQQQQLPMPAHPAQVVEATAAERSWLAKYWIPIFVGFGFASFLFIGFGLTANTSYNSGFDAGHRAGVTDTQKNFSSSPWYSRLGSAVTGELPK